MSHCDNLDSEELCEIKKLVKTIIECKGQDSITTHTDSSYNNAPNRRCVYQPGTQVHTPLIECETNKNLIVGLASHSQLYAVSN